MDKYLFLDFDGVLNTNNYTRRLKRQGIDPYDEFGAMFDPVAIHNLNNIVEQTYCKIIISSAWRTEGLMRMRSLWRDRNLPGSIFSMTPILLSTTFKDSKTGEIFGYTERNAKALEINAWLQQNGAKQYNYAIIDDENVFFQHQQEHLVIVYKYEGLTFPKTQIAINMLNKF